MLGNWIVAIFNYVEIRGKSGLHKDMMPVNDWLGRPKG